MWSSQGRCRRELCGATCFTLYGLRALWAVYIIDRIFPLVAVLSNPKLSAASVATLFALLLQTYLDIVIFRLLIEVAAAVLFGRPQVAAQVR
jgi:hypothetical protein